MLRGKIRRNERNVDQPARPLFHTRWRAGGPWRVWRESRPDRSDHDFFVGTARVLVHNANGPCPLRPWSEVFKIAQKVVNGRLPLDALTPEEREIAAEFYERTAQNVVNIKNKDYAIRYNLERAKVLRGLRGPVPKTLPDYIKAVDSGQEH